MRRLAFLLLLAAGAGGDEATRALARDTSTLLDELDAEVQARREGGRGAEADVLALQVAALRQRAETGGQPASASLPEVHVVRLGRRRVFRNMERIVVRVTATGRPLVLVLAAEVPTWWELEVGEGVQVARVLRVGSNQNVRGIRVRAESVEDMSLASAEASAIGAAMESKLGARLATCLSVDFGEGGPIVVGPGNPDWQAQHLHADALDLYWRSTRARRAAQREELKKVRFGYLYRWLDKGQGHFVSFGAWTPLGPLLARQNRIPDVLTTSSAAVADKERGDVYVLRSWVLIRYTPDPAMEGRLDEVPKGPTQVLRVPDTLPDVKEPCALAIDTRRQRLLLATRHEHGYLYALDLKTQEWSCINDMDDVDTAGMAYDDRRDAVLCVEYGERGTLRLHRFSADEGRHVHSVVLHTPPLPEARPLSAASSDGRLVVVYPPSEARSHRVGEDSRVFVIEPHTGDVIFASRVRPWEDFDPLTETDLDRAWGEMLDEDDAALRAMRLLAGQGDAAVPFLARKLMPEVGSAEDLERCVARLSDDDAFVRDCAQQELVEAGDRAEEYLESIDLSTLSAEARRRVATAIVEVGAPRRIERGIRAVRVLEWMESPAAEALLRELGGKGEPRRAAAARAALQRSEGPRR